MYKTLKKLSYDEFARYKRELTEDGWDYDDQKQLSYNPTAFAEFWSKGNQKKVFLDWGGVGGQNFVEEIDRYDSSVYDYVMSFHRYEVCPWLR